MHAYSTRGAVLSHVTANALTLYRNMLMNQGPDLCRARQPTLGTFSQMLVLKWRMTFQKPVMVVFSCHRQENPSGSSRET